MLFKDGVSVEGLDPTFLLALQYAERWAGFELTLTSAFRADDDGAHGMGLAVDIRCHDSKTRWILVEALRKAAIRRIVLYSRHIHADRRPGAPDRIIALGGESK